MIRLMNLHTSTIKFMVWNETNLPNDSDYDGLDQEYQLLLEENRDMATKIEVGKCLTKHEKHGRRNGCTIQSNGVGVPSDVRLQRGHLSRHVACFCRPGTNEKGH